MTADTVLIAPPLFGVCPVPKCSNPVDDGKPCGECAGLIAEGIIRQAEPRPDVEKPPAADVPEAAARGEWEQERVDRWRQAAGRPEGQLVTHDLTEADYQFRPAEGVADCCRFYCWSGALPCPGDTVVLRNGRYLVTAVDPSWGQYPACQWMAELEPAPEVAEAEPADQKNSGEYKANQHCWVCEQRRTCRQDPEMPTRWICKECDQPAAVTAGEDT